MIIMGYSNPDVYYQPEHFGLTPIIEVELDGESYEFNILMVWKGQDGKLYTATDSGCSCPSPFEDYISIDDLEVVGPGWIENELIPTLRSAANVSPVEAAEYVEKVRNA